MYKKTILRPVLVIGILSSLFVACDKDFDELGTNIVGDDHYGFSEYSDAKLSAYNQDLGNTSSNNLPINALGFYNDGAFGNTHANFVTQVAIADANLTTTFNNTDPTNYQVLPSVDSVIVEIPYFKHVPEGATITDGVTPYVLDSIYGEKVNTQTVPNPAAKFKLSVYRSGYYLRDYDPDQSFGVQQLFYTSQDGLIDANKIGIALNDLPTTNPLNADGHENENFYFDEREHKTSVLDDDGVTPVYTRSVPSLRLHLNKAVFNDLILNAPSGKLTSNEVFKDYFRGLYFKTENGNPGNMAMINFAAGKVTMYYSEDKKTLVAGSSPATYTYPRVNKTFVLNLTGNSVSLLNTVRNADYNAAMSNTGAQASRLYVKGGVGSMAVIKLFDSEDNYKYVIATDGVGNQIKDSFGNLMYIKVNTTNGVSDELDDLRYPLVQGLPAGSPEYHSTKNRWLINEANLTFFVDQSKMLNSKDANRVYLYDIKNKKVLADYTLDFTTNGFYPKYNKYVFGGIYMNQDGTVVNGGDNSIERAYKYRIRLTSHIRNLIVYDSTNVNLGLIVTENIANVTSFSKRQNPGSDAVISAPYSSVMNPLGTILYGANIPFGDPDYEKRLKLQIYYTKPESN
ncbi:DUF4270 domain-containing protein [Flavobacterium sp. XGLA_31]|uniref:DUF4270 domain-containing protein n=1 Tax=Flavobacterium sp. XGLA_31 TaxID=3447666 RepID=UPI003F2E4973